jgi:TIR domain/Domain of unknown function (DUF4062)
VAAVERAISTAGHVIVDMADFPAASRPPAQLCVERVRSCDVYLGVLGTRYGSLVRDMQEMSYTELEFDTAIDAGLDRLVFLLDIDAENSGMPASALIDREFGIRQDAFRARVQDSGLITQLFAGPDMLRRLVEHSLRELAATRRRINSGNGRGRSAIGRHAVFLSYRNEDAAPYARLLQLQLRERLPKAQIFMDLDSTEPGLDRAEVIAEAVDASAVLVALIGRQWVTLGDEEGHKRLDDPDDSIRIEVQTALERRVRLIPVLVDGARPVRRNQLPSELQKLARLGSFELSQSRYQDDVGRLLDLIQRLLGEAPATAHPPSPVTDSTALEGREQPILQPEARGPSCWRDDPNWLDGYVWVSSSFAEDEGPGCYFDTTILDDAGQFLPNQIDAGKPFHVRFRAETRPHDRWLSSSGTWAFDLTFSPIGEGTGFNLSRLLPSGTTMLANWQGGVTHCIEVTAHVPPYLLTRSGKSYAVAATVRFEPASGGVALITGTEALDEYYILPAAPYSGKREQRVFVSYSHRDERYRQRLDISLTSLRRNGLISVWHDEKILPGQDWDREINENLNAADIVLLLVSPDFLASDFVYSHEISRALERHRDGAATVVPIILRPADWQNSPLGMLQALPREGRPVLTWSNRDEAWLDVTQGLRQLISGQDDVP